MCRPIGFLWLGQCFKQVMQCLIKPLTFQITTGVIWSCCWLVYHVYTAEVMFHIIIKNLDPITMDSRWYPIGAEQFVYQGFIHCFCLLIRCFNCHCKIGESIHQHKDGFLSISATVHCCEIQTVSLMGDWQLKTLVSHLDHYMDP